MRNAIENQLPKNRRLPLRPVRDNPSQKPSRANSRAPIRGRLPACLVLAAALAMSGILSMEAQGEFNVTPTTEATPEGGNVNVLLIQTGDERFSVRTPRGFGAQTHTDEQTVQFTSATGATVITISFTTNYAGKLPKMEDLRDRVARKYPTGSLVQTSPCFTGYGQGYLFDIFQPAAGNLTLRIRDGYIAFPEGSIEFKFSCNSADYDKERLSFAWLLNSFRSVQEPAKKAS